MDGTDCDTNTVYDFFIRSQQRNEVNHMEMIEEVGGFDMHSLLQRPRLKDWIAGLSESCLIPHKISTHICNQDLLASVHVFSQFYSSCLK